MSAKFSFRRFPLPSSCKASAGPAAACPAARLPEGCVPFAAPGLRPSAFEGAIVFCNFAFPVFCEDSNVTLALEGAEAWAFASELPCLILQPGSRQDIPPPHQLQSHREGSHQGQPSPSHRLLLQGGQGQSCAKLLGWTHSSLLQAARPQCVCPFPPLHSQKPSARLASCFLML